MMYQNKLAIAVKANSRVLRELEDAVYIPFGSEYTLLIKNLNSLRANVKVSIDGTDVGATFVIQPNSSLDLERFIKEGNMNAGNKFKFIERTAAISNHRGNKIDDGLIRVEFEFEQQRPPARLAPIWPIVTTLPYEQYYNGFVGSNTFGEKTIFTNTANPDGTYSAGASGQMSDFMSNVSTSDIQGASTPLSKGVLRSRGVTAQAQTAEVGITVPGSISDQKFVQAAWFPTDGVKHVMVLRVLGEVAGEPVMAPVTVKTKPTCASCGRTNKAGAKFCTECGTGLQIV